MWWAPTSMTKNHDRKWAFRPGRAGDATAWHSLGRPWQKKIRLAQNVTDVSIFVVMPFGLKNAGATYKRMIQTCLEKHIGKAVEAYVDNVVIKTKHVKSLVDDLRLTFDNWCLLRNLLLVDVVGPPSGEFYRTIAILPQVDGLRFINPWEV